MDQPAPPHIIFEALTEPSRDPQRPPLMLLDNEVAPKVLMTRHPDTVVQSSLWTKRPDAVIRFDVPLHEADYGSDLQDSRSGWAGSDEALIGHMRKRLNELTNASLRYSFGQ